VNRIIKEYKGLKYRKYESQGALHWSLYSKSTKEKPESSYKMMVDDSIVPLKDCKGTILDIGCGDGLIASLLLRIGLKVTGVDDNQTGIDITNMLTRRMRTYCEPIERFINRRQRYDYMVCIDVIEHLKDPKIIVDMMQYVDDFMIVTTDHDGKLTKASSEHVTQFIPEEIEELFKGYKMERIPMRVPYFFSYKIYAKRGKES